ncbi:MAG: aldolase/citrate lyase family protein [Planctomycetaceae bacterium]
MRKNPVKQRLQSGEPSIGTFVFEFNTSGICRIAGQAGAEFVILDMEHTGWSVETIRELIATNPPSGPAPFVRVPAVEYHFIARVLDCGAMGLMFPMVETVEQAKCIVNSAKYPPTGRRGAAFGIAHDDYDGRDIQATIESANNEQLLIAQIETKTGLDNVEAIAAVDGIDVLWIGQFDLSSSLGIPGQFDHPDFQAAMDRVLSVCREHGKAAGFMALSVEEGQMLIDRGFRAIAYGGDLWLYQQALHSGLKQIREHEDRD